MRGDGESAERLEGEGGAGQRVGKYFVRVVGMVRLVGVKQSLRLDGRKV